ncbi:MAG: 4-hydroxy-3-methylbut-2-enyl diphosphate reductase [Chloroflexi bacterium RBG_16_50_9]|nr:MAG: 4-hydroxy-3-methylbut-2-enyl diphosphate reductase [Chloroflexi bacterium RBG_16_50_9]
MIKKKSPVIEKASKTGFCFGVRRAINLLEKVALELSGVETLGAVVHNQQVLQRLSTIGVTVVKNVDDIKGNVVVTSSHGVSPSLEERIRELGINIINATCPFVRRAQMAAHRLADSGFLVIVYGDAKHPEVTGILGWAEGRGLATTDEKLVANLAPPPRRLGILSQTTQVPDHFAEFSKKIIDSVLTRDYEIRIIDTICHDIRERQAAALDLARRAGLMLVVGGRSSANTNRLTEICSRVTETHLIETAEDIQLAWIQGKSHIGVTSGASTAEQTVDEVLQELENLT